MPPPSNSKREADGLENEAESDGGEDQARTACTMVQGAWTASADTVTVPRFCDSLSHNAAPATREGFPAGAKGKMMRGEACQIGDVGQVFAGVDMRAQVW